MLRQYKNHIKKIILKDQCSIFNGPDCATLLLKATRKKSTVECLNLFELFGKSLENAAATKVMRRSAAIIQNHTCNIL